MRERLKRIIETNTTWQGRLFDRLVTTLIVLSALTFRQKPCPISHLAWHMD